MTQGNQQWSHVEGDHNRVFQAERDVRVRHVGDKHRTNKFSFKGLGLAVLGVALFGGGGAVVYNSVTADTAKGGASVAEAVGTWELKPSGSVGDTPSLLTVGADGAFDLRITIEWNFPNMGGGDFPANQPPSMTLNCAGAASENGDHLLFNTTAGPCGAMEAKVHQQRIDLTFDSGQGQGRQTMSLTRQ
ncbi:hypothetical protein ACQPZF_41895 [Actinosynnema sp. CS-041913]|uniref:hypothetical protein n=1 Tax=Actinosynnema sp. CS-041913 TaxID=3239917 RepID=UPI003D92BC8E